MHSSSICNGWKLHVPGTPIVLQPVVLKGACRCTEDHRQEL